MTARHVKRPAAEQLNRGRASFDVSIDAANSARQAGFACNTTEAISSERRMLRLAAERDCRALLQAGERRRRALEASSDEERPMMLEQIRETGRKAELQIATYAEHGPGLMARFPFATREMLRLYRTGGLTIEQAEQRLQRVYLEVPNYKERIARAHEPVSDTETPKSSFLTRWGKPLIRLQIVVATIAATYTLIKLLTGTL